MARGGGGLGHPRGGSSRASTDRVEFKVSASEYGSVTTLVTTPSTAGAKTVTSNAYSPSRHDGSPVTRQTPSSPRVIATRSSAASPPRARSPPPRARSPPPRARSPPPRARSPPPHAKSPPPHAGSPPAPLPARTRRSRNAT